MRRLGSFALVFLPVFVLSAALYPTLWPAWQTLVLGLANILLGLADWQLLMDAEGGVHHIGLLRPEGLIRTRRAASAMAHFHLALAILPALLLATPVALRERLRLLALGVGLLVVVHALAVVGLAYELRCHASGAALPLCTWTEWKVNVAGELAAFALWALLTWRFWTGVSASPSRAAACT